MLRIISLVLTLSLAGTSWLQAQNMSSTYQTAVGVKVWNGGGITVKHFIRDGHGIEGILFFWNRGIRVTGLYELHFPINPVEGLQWYIGPGAHLGYYGNGINNGPGNNGTFIGIDGVLGLDYKINKAPLNLSVDWQPSFEFGSSRGFWGWGGIGVRYAF